MSFWNRAPVFFNCFPGLFLVSDGTCLNFWNLFSFFFLRLFKFLDACLFYLFLRFVLCSGFGWVWNEVSRIVTSWCRGLFRSAWCGTACWEWSCCERWTSCRFGKKCPASRSCWPSGCWAAVSRWDLRILSVRQSRSDERIRPWCIPVWRTDRRECVEYLLMLQQPLLPLLLVLLQLLLSTLPPELMTDRQIGVWAMI